MYKFGPGIQLVTCSKLIEACHISNRWNPWTGAAYAEKLQ
jgi:hypothetical protein